MADPIHERLVALHVRAHALRWPDGRSWDGFSLNEETGDWGIRFPAQCWVDLFEQVLPGLTPWRWNKMKGAALGTFATSLDTKEIDLITEFFIRFEDLVLIDDLTNGTMALSYHGRGTEEEGLVERTRLGELVHAAKPYNAPPDNSHEAAADELAREMARLLADSRLVEALDGMVAVPGSDPKKTFHLPAELVTRLAGSTGLPDLSRAIGKNRATPQLKNLSLTKKVEALRGSIDVSAPESIRGKSILLVDDLYQSGTTLNFVSELLREAGAKSCHGLTATKTLGNRDNTSWKESR